MRSDRDAVRKKKIDVAAGSGLLSFLMPIIGHRWVMRNAGEGFWPPHRIDIDLVPCAAAEIGGRNAAFLPLGHQAPVQPLR